MSSLQTALFVIYPQKCKLKCLSYVNQAIILTLVSVSDILGTMDTAVHFGYNTCRWQSDRWPSFSVYVHNLELSFQWQVTNPNDWLKRVFNSALMTHGSDVSSVPYSQPCILLAINPKLHTSYELQATCIITIQKVTIWLASHNFVYTHIQSGL